ncbi:DNA methylase [Mesorhizobium sp. LSJC268A00]|uniref:DNA methyltransferase n=1 Tax=unclassified Mesorhizobium TaxID=325217 RepID=UPI0003CF20E2|nr:MULTISPECIES: DNA methyltransferase [unclassified Mesorhizobium]ESX06799.1 DNA methylase [Mesorhizobium sp. LSJC268A00]ESX13495.1 DNA methylase [Mesorhizobium sp. LSJC265A00]ESX31934.1 DNA methylase [Mesorhizobium sp. LSHC440B00]ESX39349.1 DNA methylase [Mesorhizobium sp. LSHC432A00]ESX44294.1 DNA methylase [Mesorhizobium sp. LSHC440A00]
MNKLFFGDNLDVLRRQVKDESVDLVYLDPPFNSNANYNVLFKEGAGIPSEAQAEAFRDTWSWGESAAIAFDDVMREGDDLALVLRAFRAWLGDNSMMAYLAMMAVRLIELHRALKPTGSLYLHCDSTASHYLKMLLDTIFGPRNYRNEIIWKRTTAHSDTKSGFSRVTDTIFFYAKSDKATWNTQYGEHSESYKASHYRHVDAQRRHYRHDNIIRSQSMGPRPNLVYEYNGFTPPHGWRVVREKLAEIDRANRIYWSRNGVPYLIRYLDEQKGEIVDNLWTDIFPVNSQARERLGYPTQKPLALLERILNASSNPGDIVLDPFCGCGTSVEAAERLNRKWIGIDVTHYAITLIERRLRKIENVQKFEVSGRPTDLAGARDLARRDKHQFQWWASWLLGAQTYESKKGADRGIDGNIYFANGPYGFGRIIVSVKGGEHLGPAMVRELSGVVQREEDANMGILVTLAEPTKAMLSDAAGAGFVERSAHGRLPRVQIVTVGDLLDGRYPAMPPLPPPAVTKIRTRAARDRDQLELLLPFDVDGLKIPSGAILDPRYLALNSETSRRSS